MSTWIPFILLLGMLLFSASVAAYDHRRRQNRLPAGATKLSVLIPCYNDAATLAATLDSIFASCRHLEVEVLVGNDASTDASASVIDQLAERYPITVHHNKVNLGKSETLNRMAALATHEILLFVDADTVLNPRAVADLWMRLESDPRLGAVSCPYQPLNKGWLPNLQSIDYSMIALLQGGYNLFSGLALWGGCIAVRRSAFMACEGFSLSAITEDVDLAHKLNRNGWRVQQSMVAVRSWVPGTIQEWIHQKMRWTAGGFQCLFRHPAVWIRNPMHIALIGLYSFLSIHCVHDLIQNTLMLRGIIQILDVLNDFFPWRDYFPALSYLYASMIRDQLWLFVGFILLNGLYVIPLIRQRRDLLKLFLVLPFMLAYFPAYMVVASMGLGHFILHSRRLAIQEARAW